MLVTSRSFAEYEAMFDLSEQDLIGRVLDCCAGSSSFVTELTDRGGTGVAVDPAYAMARSQLKAAATDSLGDANQIIDHHSAHFVWDWYGTPERRHRMRSEASARFLADIDRRPHHYVAGSLPHLPFTDKSHDLVLCSHLLFTWSTEFDADWHLAAIREMLRVARREVRIYPLVVQGSGEDVPFLESLLTQLRRSGHDVDTRQVSYRFQRGADAMLTVRHSRTRITTR